MDRRNFLKNTSLWSAASLGLVNPFAQSIWANTVNASRDHYFVLVQVSGGWDVTLSLDPKVHQGDTDQKDIFIEYKPEEILASKGLFFGPAFSPMIKHSQDVHVVRGIEMRRDAGHGTNLEIMSSGYGDGQTALFPIELYATTQKGPMGVLIQNSIPSGKRSAVLTSLGSITSNGSSETLAPDLLNPHSHESTSFQMGKRGVIDSESKKEEIAKVVSKLMSEGMNDSELASIVAAFKAKASFQASYSISENLDTHAGHETTHMNLQKNVWQKVSDLFDYFKSIEYENGVSLFDQTTFLVVSEFARTPALNGSKGKDHNPHCNCALLAGKGIRGGYSTGESFVINRHQSDNNMSKHISRAIDFNTGHIVRERRNLHKDVNLIFPESIAATLGSLYGSPKDFYGEHLKGRVIRNVLR